MPLNTNGRRITCSKRNYLLNFNKATIILSGSFVLFVQIVAGKNNTFLFLEFFLVFFLLIIFLNVVKMCAFSYFSRFRFEFCEAVYGLNWIVWFSHFCVLRCSLRRTCLSWLLTWLRANTWTVTDCRRSFDSTVITCTWREIMTAPSSSTFGELHSYHSHSNKSDQIQYVRFDWLVFSHVFLHSTIGKLEPSYVIRKFLDAQRIHNLTAYLQALHRKSLANADHTTLLLNCYTKLKDSSKLEEFIKVMGSRVQDKRRI